MKILGIGVDIIQNKRIKDSIKNHKFKIEFTVLMNLNYLVIQKIKLDISQKDLLQKKLLLKPLGQGLETI
jgi:holo-[acyl-carrier protein] synthase